MKKKIVLWMALWASVLMVVSILIPSILVKKQSQAYTPVPDTWSSTPQVQVQLQVDEQEELIVPIYLTKENRIESVPLEHYVRGVIAAEMPIEFELEALKAQAIAARTYILHRIVEQDFSNVPSPNAWVTDTIAHQAYITEDQMKQKWVHPTTYSSNLSKLNQAVNETKGVIAIYEDKPISAVFFSTSNGFTENSEDYWSNAVPYLRSVPSPWDKQISPKYKVTVTLSQDEVYEKLGLPHAIPASTAGVAMQEFKVLETTEGNRIKLISIAGQLFSGREVREKLGLHSSQFSAKRNGDHIEFTTYGYGHGVGMSQWGAQGMAIEGKTAEQIIQYYYQNVEMSKLEELLKKSST